MAVARVPPCRTARLAIVRLAGLAAAGLLAQPGAAGAFPLFDPTNTDTGYGPSTTELATPDAQDLRHQLQLGSGLLPPVGGGWTFIPRLGVQEAFNDNVFQAESPRHADLTTYISPGIAIAGDTSRLQLTVNYSPTLEMFLINGSQNAITQQLNAIGLLTLVPDRFYVDLRAVAGVQATNGISSGLGSLGSGSVSATTASTLGSITGTGLGLSKENRTQTVSAGLSPYVVGRLGQFGDYRIGASIDVSHNSQANGFAVLPFGTNNNAGSQSLVTTQETARFSSGDYFATVQDQLDINVSQSNGTYENPAAIAAANGTTGEALLSTGNTSTRETATNQVTWHYDQAIALVASAGYEDIRYSGGSSAPNINDVTWSIGTNLTPNQDTFLSVSYGHQQGANSLTVNGHYAATARTVISVSYGSTVGTQLENVQNQLDLAQSNGNGGLINGQTGGTLFNNSNLLAVQTGVYRFNNFNLSSTTTFDRDTVSLALTYSTQSTVTGSGQSSGASTTVEYGSGTWVHSLNPDMTLSGAISYGRQTPNAGAGTQTVSASAVFQYTLSETLTTSLRYVFYDQISSAPGASVYQDLIILGFTKTF